MSRWATVQALVEQQTFAIYNTDFIHTRQKEKIADFYYSVQPPTQGLLLAGPYWVLYKMGIDFKHRPTVQSWYPFERQHDSGSRDSGHVHRSDQDRRSGNFLRNGNVCIFGPGFCIYNSVDGIRHDGDRRQPLKTVFIDKNSKGTDNEN